MPPGPCRTWTRTSLVPASEASTASSSVELRLRAVLGLDHGVGEEVVVPLRVGGGAADRGDSEVLAAALDPHQRVLAQGTGLPADRGDDHDRVLAAAQGVGLGAARGLVLLDLVADPLGRAGD